MNSNEVKVFHLYRADGRSLILIPFKNPEKFNDALSTQTFFGFYGREPEVEVMTYLKGQLYSTIDDGINQWISDRRFIPAFLSASGIFLLVYLFMSLVIRDPIPIVDELLGSVAAALVSFFFIRNKSRAARKAFAQKTILLNRCDAITFSESSFLVKIESWLKKVEGMNRRSLVSTILFPEDGLCAKEDHDFVNEILKGLKHWLGQSTIDKIEKNLKSEKSLLKLPDKDYDKLPIYSLIINLENSLENKGIDGKTQSPPLLSTDQ